MNDFRIITSGDKRVLASFQSVRAVGNISRSENSVFAPGWEIFVGDVLAGLRKLPSDSVHCIITSPPYWSLRDYNVKGQIGLEPDPQAWLRRMLDVGAEMKRVLRPDGTMWVNLGDSYAQGGRGAIGKTWGLDGSRRNLTASRAAIDARGEAGRRPPPGIRAKNLVGQPWMLAFAYRDELELFLRMDIIWSKPNPMPESIKDRPTKSHEYVFLFSKQEQNYFYDNDAIREPYKPESLARRQYRDVDVSERRGEHQPDEARAAASFGKPHPPGAEIRERAARSPNGVKPPEQDHAYIGANPGGRNRRSVWEVNSEPFRDGHFATFPTKLIEPMILAGTSAEGCCRDCGKPFERVVELGEQDAEWIKAMGANADGTYHGEATKDYEAAGAQDPSAVKERILASARLRETVAWEPTCHRLKCGTCKGVGVTETAIRDHVFAGLPPVVVRPIPPCPNSACRGRGWWAASCQEYAAWQDPDRGLRAWLPGGWLSSKCADCGHEAQSHGADFDCCGRCTCRRFRFEKDVPVPATVLDPFSGAATTGVVARRHKRRYLGIELNPEYAEMGANRLVKDLQRIRDVEISREHDIPLEKVGEKERKQAAAQMKLFTEG